MRYVIALGGNAIKDSSSIAYVADVIAGLYARRNEVVVTHGNGPQVGELAESERRNLAILTAQTEAWIGLEISNKISVALRKANVARNHSIPAVVLTDVLVSNDPDAFKNPSKPIGRFYNEKEAELLRKKGLSVKKLIHGYRRVVPSPHPKTILQKDLIEYLLKGRHIVIACGGGGIPLIDSYGRLEYVDAVIDKDRASGLLAKEIKADRFIILTNVDGAYINFGKKNHELLKRIKAVKIREYLDLGYFEDGSMGPKVESCIDFVKSTGKMAEIGNMSNPEDITLQKRHTIVIP